MVLAKAKIFEEYVWSDTIGRLSCVTAETRWANYKALMIYERLKARRLKKLHQAITVPLNHQRQPISRQLLENQDKRINFVVIHAPAAEPESCSAGKWTKLYFRKFYEIFARNVSAICTAKELRHTLQIIKDCSSCEKKPFSIYTGPGP